MSPWLGKTICLVEAGFEAAGLLGLVWAIAGTVSTTARTMKRKYFIAGVYTRSRLFVSYERISYDELLSGDVFAGAIISDKKFEEGTCRLPWDPPHQSSR